MKNKRYFKSIVAIISAIVLFTSSFTTFADSSSDYKEISDIEVESSNDNEENKDLLDTSNEGKLEEKASKTYDAPSEEEGVVTEGSSKKTEGLSSRLRSTPETVIPVMAREVLILGENNRYIIKTLKGSNSTLNPPAIRDSDWEDAPPPWEGQAWNNVLRSGFYDANSIVEVDGSLSSYSTGSNIYTIPGLTATLQQIRVKTGSLVHAQLYVLKDTNLIINSGSIPGIDFSAEPQGLHPYDKDNMLYIHPDANIKITSDYQGIKNPKYSVTARAGSVLDIETTKISSEPSVEVGAFGGYGTNVTVNSKSTAYAIKSGAFSSFRFTDSANLNVTVPSGVGLSIIGEVFFEKDAIIDIHVQGNGTGIEIFHKPLPSNPGFFTGASLIMGDNNPQVSIKVDGVGKGIFIPLDSKGSEIKLLGGKLDVKVNDGVGIYSPAFISLLSPTVSQKSINVEVQTGVAGVISRVSDVSSTGAGITLSFVSHGASTNTQIEPGVNMPTSAGLVIFPRGYWFTEPDATHTIIAKAPKDIVGSYGIYVLPGILDNYLRLENTILEVEGDIGIDAGEVALGDTAKIDSTTYGIIASSLTVNTATNLTLNGTEAAVKLRNYYVDPIAGDKLYFQLNNSTVNLNGGKYGIIAENKNNIPNNSQAISINDSNLNIIATEPNSVGMTFNNDPSITEIQGKISNSNIDINAQKDGIIIKGFSSIDLTAGAVKNTIKSVADDVALHIDTVMNISGNYDVHGVSRKTAPDATGKTPSIYTEGKKINLISNAGLNPTLIEEYETETTGVIKEATPYMAYAADRNAVINNGTWLADINGTITPLTVASDGLSSNISVKGAKVTGTMNSGNTVSFSDPGSIYNIVFPSNFNIVSVTFDPDGGAPTPSVVGGLLIGDKIPAPSVTVEKTGYTLTHWEHNGQKWDFATDTITSTEDIILVAKWTKTSKIVTFDKNTTDTATNMPVAIAVDYDDLFNKPTEIPKRVGYTFAEWYKEAATTNLWDFAVDKMPSNDITLYAKWDINKHDVIFDKNAGADIVGNMPSNITNVVFDTTFADPGTTPTRTGYTFAGWYKEATTVNSWNFITDKMPDNNVTLYAKWDVNKHDLTFNGNTGTPLTQKIEVAFSSLLPNPITIVSKEGHTLEGWYEDAALAIKVDFATFTMPDNDIEIFAKWTINKYNVSFDGNAAGATINNMPAVQNIDFDTLAVEPVVNPDRHGYAFEGWYKDQAGTILWDFAIDKVPAKDVVLYAKWFQTHFNVIFDVNTGEPSTTPQNLFIKAGDTADISMYQPGTSSAPKKDGYLFVGWKDVSGSYSPATFTMPRQDIVLKAEWADWSSNIVLTSDKNIVIYKEGASKDKVVSNIKATAEIVTSNGIKVTKDVEFEWDESSLTTGGVYVIKLYVLDDLGNKHYGKDTIDLYVLNNPYISSSDAIILHIGDPIRLNGESWNAKLIEEKVDFSSRKIVRILHKVNQDVAGVDTSTPGDYGAKLFGTVIDHFGKAIDLTKNVKAMVMAKGDISDVEKTMVDSTYFWEEVSKGLHLSKKGELWNFNKNNYKYGGDLSKEKVSSTTYDRKVYVKAEPFFKMSAEVLQILQEQNNSMLEVNLETIVWNFHSKDYQNTNIIPTGFFDLSFKSHYVDDDIRKVIPKGNMMQLSFNMNKHWIGTPTMSVVLNNELKDSAAKGNKLYLFKYNEDTKELELIGKMDTNGNMASIKMKEVRLRYVILDKLPGGYVDNSVKNISGSSEVKSFKSAEKTGEGFRITEATNKMNQETYDELKNDISLINKNIDEVSVINLESLVEETNSSDNKLISKGRLLILGGLLVVLLATLLIVLIVKRRKEEADSDINEINY